jgi:hypothetical protein
MEDETEKRLCPGIIATNLNRDYIRESKMQRKDKENMIFKKVFEQLNNVGTEVMN